MSKILCFDEDRFLVLGRSLLLRALVVCHCKQTTIRIGIDVLEYFKELAEEIGIP
jgi:hypothetical protein